MRRRSGLNIPETLEDACDPATMALIVYDMQAGVLRQLPDGVYLTAVKQQDKRLKFEGVAQSSTRVSTFMRNIDSSEWMQHSELEVIETKGGSAAPGSSFTVFADQVSNAGQDDGKAAGKKLASRGTP